MNGTHTYGNITWFKTDNDTITFIGLNTSSFYDEQIFAIAHEIMLMYGREAQSKTRIASPATIPKSGERNRKIHSCMLYLISI